MTRAWQFVWNSKTSTQRERVGKCLELCNRIICKYLEYTFVSFVVVMQNLIFILNFCCDKRYFEFFLWFYKIHIKIGNMSLRLTLNASFEEGFAPLTWPHPIVKPWCVVTANLAQFIWSMSWKDDTFVYHSVHNEETSNLYQHVYLLL